MPTDLTAFRQATRQWLEDHGPASMRTPASAEEAVWGGKKETRSPDAQRWLDVNVERGFTAPTWPKEYGGAGL